MNLSPTRVILALAPMVLGLPLAMDIYIPAVPAIADLFDISAEKMQLTLTLFMLTSSIIPLFVGPLSDQYGRKRLSYLMIFVFALGTILCGFSQTVNQLITFRILQAIGACSMLAIAFAIVRDLFHGQQSALVYSLLNGIIAFSPMLAPFLGSYLDINLGWPATFFALLIIAIFSLLFTSILLPESLPKFRRKPISSTIFKEYKQIASHQIFIIYNYAIAAGLAYIFIFCLISPYVIIRLFHIPELQYGYYFFFMGISFFLGSLLAAFFVKRIGTYYTVFIGFFISLSGGILMSIWYYTIGFTINSFIWPMLLIGSGGTMAMGAGNGGAMEPFKKVAGTAAAVSNFIRFAFSAILGLIVSIKTISSTLPLAIPTIVLNIIGIILFLHYKKLLKTQESN